VRGAGEPGEGHARLLREIAADFRETAYLTGIGRMSPAVERALAAVPRAEFVDEDDRGVAWVNRPLEIGHGQTISQPFIVAIMTELAQVDAGDRVLEIGTGSGYQAAVLAELGASVHTIEIVPALAARARATLTRLGYEEVKVRTGDGNRGWPEAAPYDAILVTAAGRLPPALVAQLKPGGRMVIPLGTMAEGQTLTVIGKRDDGSVAERAVLPVRFVPLTGAN
jgi:protein-L-isoaspartate(D-aspartate) O-methyltransferase